MGQTGSSGRTSPFWKRVTNERLTQTTLCLPVLGEPVSSVLLGLKKTGFGAGKWTGFGGKVEPGETLAEAAIRELHEEAGLVAMPDDLIAAGVLSFRFPYRPAWSQDVHLFVTRSWSGEAKESDEMRPQWFTLDAIPYTSMWEDGRHWLPRLLAGYVVYGTFTFAADNESISAIEWSDDGTAK